MRELAKLPDFADGTALLGVEVKDQVDSDLHHTAPVHGRRDQLTFATVMFKAVSECAAWWSRLDCSRNWSRRIASYFSSTTALHHHRRTCVIVVRSRLYEPTQVRS